MKNKRRFLWLALSKLKSSAMLSLVDVLPACGGIENLPEMSADDICHISGISLKNASEIAAALKSYTEKGEDEEKLLAKHGADFISIEEDSYPALLKYLPAAPTVLYVKGKLPDKNMLCISIVGARKADSYGRELAYRMANELTSAPAVIVSGMARGIDGAAHCGAIDAHGTTIAVLGTGIDIVYPHEHRNIYTASAENGAVVSEFPLGTQPLKTNFPRRNRIIAGISLGTVIIQADLRSGSLSTANYALEYGREVMAVPGSVLNSLSKGTHKLIKDGAQLVENADDVLICLNQKKNSVSAKETKKQLNGLPKDIYDIADGTRSVSEMADALNVEMGDFFSALSFLELNGYIKRCAGGIYIKQ